jgi:hypothetical protein
MEERRQKKLKREEEEGEVKLLKENIKQRGRQVDLKSLRFRLIFLNKPRMMS